MKLLQMEITQKQIPTPTRPALSRWLALAADRLKLVWRSVIWRSISLVRRAGSKRKTLAVRETAASATAGSSPSSSSSASVS